MGGEAPGVHFPANSGDNNTSKMVGGRLDIALPPWVEFNVSGLTAKYDSTKRLRYSAMDLAGELHAHNLEWRTEYVHNWQQIDEMGTTPSISKQGVYSQLAYRFNAWEPVFRYTRMFDAKQEGAVIDEAKWQAGFGLDYWFSPSISLMAGYEVNRETGMQVANDRFVIHFAYGF